MRNVLITGKPGCGKSTLINEIIKRLEDKKIAGIITPEIRKNSARYGFKIIDLKSKEEDILASVNIKTKFRVSKYFVNIEGIDKIVDKFLISFEDAEYIFIDEIGTMELYSKKFGELLNKIFSSNKKIVAVIHRNLINNYKDKGIVYYLEKENFDEVLNKILLSL